MRSGKIALVLILLGFILFMLTIFQGEVLFFSSIKVEPTEIFGTGIPETIEVEQSFKTREGYIFSGIDRTNKLRIQLVKESGNSDVSQYQGTESLLKDAKIFVTTRNIATPNIFVRYLAANIDPRRTEIQQILPQETKGGDTNLVLLKAQKQKFFGVIFFLKEKILFIASHPEHTLSEEQVVASAKSLNLF